MNGTVRFGPVQLVSQFNQFFCSLLLAAMVQAKFVVTLLVWQKVRDLHGPHKLEVSIGIEGSQHETEELGWNTLGSTTSRCPSITRVRLMSRLMCTAGRLRDLCPTFQ